jgi:hypothetical protein
VTEGFIDVYALLERISAAKRRARGRPVRVILAGQAALAVELWFESLAEQYRHKLVGLPVIVSDALEGDLFELEIEPLELTGEEE